MTEPMPYGPDRAMIDRVGVCLLSPLWINDVDDATKDRLQAAYERSRTWDDLPADLRELLERGERQVQAGLSPALYDPSEWGSNWASEDAELDLADDEPEEKGFDFDEPDDEPVLPAADDDGWVGV